MSMGPSALCADPGCPRSEPHPMHERGIAPVNEPDTAAIRADWSQGYVSGCRSSDVVALCDALDEAKLAERVLELPCQNCDGENPVWWAPNALWNDVIGTPDNPRGEGTMLCPSCFCARVEAARPI